MSVSDALATITGSSVALKLLQSNNLAHLAYSWKDGTPRVVPMWFYWTGEAVLMGAPPNAPKMKALTGQPTVAITIDSNDWPYQVLSVRGNAQIEIVDGFFAEYGDMAERYLGSEGRKQFLDLAGSLFSQWARITIRPDEVRMLDFGTGQFPSAWGVVPE